MLLTRANVLGYLISRGLLDARAAVHEGVCMVEASQRNTSFHITRRAGEGFAVKQVAKWSAASCEAMQREACLYARVGQGQLAMLQAHLPACHHYDAEQQVLTLELLEPAESLAELLRQSDPVPAATALAQLGRTLGRLHRETGMKARRTMLAEDFAAWLPWAMQDTGEFVDANDYVNVDDDVNVFDNVHVIVYVHDYGSASPSNAVRQFHDLLQRHSTLQAHLAQLRREWRTACLIHTDLKGEHGLIHYGQLKLIDWEMATLGDPCWDIGSVFALCLLPWVEAAAQASAAATPLLLTAQHSITHFWQAYTSAHVMRPAQRASRLRQSVRFAAARLIQTAYEDAHMRPDLSPREALLLQLAQNMLCQPDEAVQRVLGL